MPTVLPTPRVAPAKKRSLLRIVFDLVFNTAFVVGALVLTFVVLVRECGAGARGTIMRAARPTRPHCPSSNRCSPPKPVNPRAFCPRIEQQQARTGCFAPGKFGVNFHVRTQATLEFGSTESLSGADWISRSMP